MLEMGPQEDYIETVLTCEGDFDDPQLHSRLEKFRRSLKDLLLTDMHKLILKKVEPWNSVRVTFNIPKEAALRLKQLAQQGNAALRELGVLAVQIQGDQVVSLTIAGRNNERTELILRTAESRPGQPAASVFDTGLHSSDELNSPGPSNVEVTRKNIAEYLRQGTSLFETIIQPQAGPGNGVFRSPNVVATSSEPIPFRPNNVISTSPGNTSTVTSQAPMFMSNFPPGRSPTGYPASPSASYSTSPGPSRSPVHQPGLKYPSPPGIPPAIPSAIPSVPPVGSVNHVGLPPPPPYPGVATVNNIPRPGKAVSVSSPLLVNLLQTEPLVAGFNNLPGSKMLPPQVDGPPTKKRRRVKKPKEANKPSPVPSDGEVPIQSVLNPALDAASVLSNDRVESSMDSTLAGHPADPNVSLNPSQRSVVPLLGNQARSNNVSPVDVDNRLNPESVGSGVQQASDAPWDCVPQPSVPDIVDEKGFFHEQHDPYPPEITAGKIINPYTGQLEPMDKSPVKTTKFAGGGTSVKKAQRMKSATKPNREVHDLFLNRGRKHVNKKSATVTREDMQAHVNMAGHVEENHNLFGVSERTGETEHCPPLTRSPGSAEIPAVSVIASTAAVSASVPQQIYAEAQQSSQCASTAASVSTPLSSIAVPSPTQSQASVHLSMEVMNSVSPAVPTLEAAKASPPPYPSGHPLLETSGNAQSQTQQSMSHTTELHNSDRKSPYPIDSVLQGPSAAKETALPVAQSAKASAKVDSVTLLNSPSARTTDSNCMSASPENKMPSEGDENSNHSGIINDITADNPTSASSFLDSGSNKVYNHDSGVGSSSERSDDTPSEPGDSEFRTTHPTDAEELSKTQKLVDCKSDSKQVTVGYVMEHDHMPQQHKDKNDLAHLPFTKEKLASLGHMKNHMNLNMYSQTPSDLHPNNQVTVLQWSAKDTKLFGDHTHLANSELLLNSRIGKLKNGPVMSDRSLHRDLDRASSSPPESKTVTEIGHQHHQTKHPFPKGLPSTDGELIPVSPRSQPVEEQGSDHPQFIADTLQNSQKQKPSLPKGEMKDRTSNFQCNTTSPEWLNLPGLASQPPSSVCDTETSDSLELSQSFAQSGRLEPHSPSGAEQCLANNDGRCQVTSPKSAVEKFFPSGIDIDSLQASAKGMSSKGGGSNITSKYSKRSSPVNVNMLNHIYAPGLPLPRRLTESIQRLVKPLGDPSLPQMRACKSPGASGTKHGPSGDKSPRAAHGGRSPGANVPRSSANSGIPTSQAALASASSMPSNLPNLQQNTMSGGAVSVNYNPGLPVSTTVSQTCMTQEGQSGSLTSCSGNPQVSPSDRNFYSSSQQHSTPYGTYSSSSDNQSFESSTVVASTACAAAGITPSQHQDLTDSVMVSNQQQTDLADQLVPSSLSHKCNTHSGPLSQANPPYANTLSAPADVSDICAVNQTLTQPDLIDSAASHNRTTTEMVSTSETGTSPAAHSVNCVQSEAALTAGESQQQGASLALAEGQHQSQHSIVQSAGSVENSCDAVGVDSDAQRQPQASVMDAQPVESDSSDVPKLSSVDDSDAAFVDKDSDSVKEVTTGQEGTHLENDIRKEIQATSFEVTKSEGFTNRDTKHETLDLCSSEAAKISDTPHLISHAPDIDGDMNDIPSEGDKDIKTIIPEETPVDSPPKVPLEISQAESSQEEPKPLKMVAELLKIPTSNCAPLLESVDSDQKTGSPGNNSSNCAQEVNVDTTVKSHVNAAQPPVLEPEIDTHPTRRVTRKRKSTHSESDSNSKESDMDTIPKSDVPEGSPSKSVNQHAVVDAGPPPLPPPAAKSDSANSSGPRTRETRRHFHGEEKLKNSEEMNDKSAMDKQQDKLIHLEKQQQKDVHVEKKVDSAGVGIKEDDLASKRANTSRRNKSLPAGSEKPHPYSFFDISIIRGRTRSQSAPTTENKDQKPEKEKEKEESPDSQKRSTRSSRQKDHSEQPVAKRRRSRDHR